MCIKIILDKDKLLTREGNNITLTINVTFTTLLLGGKVEIPTLDGKYMLEIKELTQSGTIMRLKGKGVTELYKSTRGDMLVTLKSEAPNKLDKKTKEKLLEIEELLKAHENDEFFKLEDE